MNSKNKIKLNAGLNNLLIPLDSKIDNSRNNIDIIGAISFLPGSTYHREPNIPKITGIKKYIINFFWIIFDKEKQIEIKTM